jgi:hypothetical protein
MSCNVSNMIRLSGSSVFLPSEYYPRAKLYGAVSSSMGFLVKEKSFSS